MSHPTNMPPRPPQGPQGPPPGYPQQPQPQKRRGGLLLGLLLGAPLGLIPGCAVGAALGSGSDGVTAEPAAAPAPTVTVTQVGKPRATVTAKAVTVTAQAKPAPTVTVTQTNEAPEPETEPEPEPDEPGSDLTSSQEQAIGSAKSYLSNSHFSKKGLIKQLEYEGFSKKDATFAVESIDVNWKEQAAGSAKAYLELFAVGSDRAAEVRGLHPVSGGVRRQEGRSLMKVRYWVDGA